MKIIDFGYDWRDIRDLRAEEDDYCRRANGIKEPMRLIDLTPDICRELFGHE